MRKQHSNFKRIFDNNSDCNVSLCERSIMQSVALSFNVNSSAFLSKNEKVCHMWSPRQQKKRRLTEGLTDQLMDQVMRKKGRKELLVISKEGRKEKETIANDLSLKFCRFCYNIHDDSCMDMIRTAISSSCDEKIANATSSPPTSLSFCLSFARTRELKFCRPERDFFPFCNKMR